MNARIAHLLRQLHAVEVDLVEAETATQAADARASIHDLRHSLWLAGWSPEDEQEDAA